MDYLIGCITDPAPGQALEPGPDAMAGQASHASGSLHGLQWFASATTGRLRSHEAAGAVYACVGAPYGTEAGGDDPAPALARAAAGDSPALATIGGEFALFAMDSASRSLVLASDAFGSVPVYYASVSGGLAFGTDLGWVARRAGAAGAIDPQALFDYLFFNVVPGSRSIFKGVHKLPPASTLSWRDGRSSLRRYWQPGFRHTDTALDGLRQESFEAISAAVGRVANLPGMGCFLSGGLDSSSVCGLAARHAGSGVRAFTIGFDVPDYDESRYARISARHFGLDLHEKCIHSADVTACLDRVIGAFPEPFGNASAVSAYLCAQFARDAGISRLLAGDGGDELFAGNERYQKQSVFNLYGGLPAWLRTVAVDPLAALSRRAPGPLRKLGSYVDQARVPLPDRLFSYNLLVRNDPAGVLTPEFLRQIDPDAPHAYARAVYAEPATGDALDRMLYLDWALTLADNDLRKVRMACDLAGVSVHFPMLDPRVAAVSTRVPSSAKLTLRELRKFYKEAFAGFLPAEVINKEKHGFGVPVGLWINGDPVLRDRVQGRLQALGRRGIVQPAFIDDLLRLQQTEHAVYYGALMWTLFMLEEWLAAQHL
ncbi:asparagine synthase (glutamine-hydrolysing) [Gammaproteobacteria bacterium]|nr:asparagine synthase [Gammaproteobacteria bacterium]CAG0939149.1 asparagine synthase (glutamine-hydrolysing) [Gammaproteobacteria bacterium]